MSNSGDSGDFIGFPQSPYRSSTSEKVGSRYISPLSPLLAKTLLRHKPVDPLFYKATRRSRMALFRSGEYLNLHR